MITSFVKIYFLIYKFYAHNETKNKVMIRTRLISTVTSLMVRFLSQRAEIVVIIQSKKPTRKSILTFVLYVLELFTAI